MITGKDEMTIQEILPYLQLLLIPILLYIIKVEVRLTKIETMQSAEYQHLMRRTRNNDLIIEDE